MNHLNYVSYPKVDRSQGKYNLPCKKKPAVATLPQVNQLLKALLLPLFVVRFSLFVLYC